jgi:hypothetical protein
VIVAKTKATKQRVDSLEVCFRSAFCAASRAPSSAPGSHATVSPAEVPARDEAVREEKRK